VYSVVLDPKLLRALRAKAYVKDHGKVFAKDHVMVCAKDHVKVFAKGHGMVFAHHNLVFDYLQIRKIFHLLIK